jgi:hypothetical protein
MPGEVADTGTWTPVDRVSRPSVPVCRTSLSARPQFSCSPTACAGHALTSGRWIRERTDSGARVSGNQRRSKKKDREPSEEVLADYRLRMLRSLGWFVLASIPAVGVLTLMAVPLAKVMAGSDNASLTLSFNFSIATTFALTTTVTTAAALIWRKRVRHLVSQKRKLEKSIEFRDARIRELEHLLEEASDPEQNLQLER